MGSSQKSHLDEMPGEDADPRDRVKDYIKIGWSLVGAFFTLGILGVVIAHFGLVVFPVKPTVMDYAKAYAFLFAVLNIGAWIYFPLLDLEIQRRWFRSLGATFSTGTTEFFMMLLQLLLLLATTISALIHPVALAIVGFGVYLWNFMGYAYIRRELLGVVPESRKIYSDKSEPNRSILLNGLSVVQDYFCVVEGSHPFRNRQQIRHLLLTFAFGLNICIATVGTINNTTILLVVSYYLSGSLFIVAELSIAIWRAQRDKKLKFYEDEWRRTKIFLR